jgi:putative transposase
VNGRKRHLLVDTLGLVMRVVVHPASTQDRDGARLLLDGLDSRFPNLALIWADTAYQAVVEWAAHSFWVVLHIVEKPPDQQGFAVLPRRWVVERTFAWLGKYRRLSKDYEALTATSEAWIYVAMSHVLLRRLARRTQAAAA